MNYDSYLARAIEIFNDKMDADFSRDDVILTCFMTDDQEEIFEQFCAHLTGICTHVAKTRYVLRNGKN